VAAFGMLLGAVSGYYLPLLMITSQAQNRQASLLRAYPDALDLMVSSVESGLSLDQAFRRVAQEMKTVSPILSKEFTLVNSQVSAGIERIEALKRLEERTGLEELRSFVNMLSQAERFGSSISESMRLYSSVAREKRMARAEEKAGQVGSKLTVIMIVFFLPVLMMVLLAPSGIRIMRGEGE
jgi:tight adherence protein C